MNGNGVCELLARVRVSRASAGASVRCTTRGLRARARLGRSQSVRELQTIMLRFLTSIPAGKVRFTIIDPVGLGDNFAAFMHLADYDENLIGSRIWTEPAQIEKRLSDITAHMENVIQKYLRNQYASIEEYNKQAGEVAEPFRVLVVANFPVNFSVDASRRLASIAASGTFFQGRFGGLTRTPRLRSIGPGAPIAMLRTFSRPRWRSISAAAHSTIACGDPSRGVLVLTLAIRFPSDRASATRTWVPPRSIPASINLLS